MPQRSPLQGQADVRELLADARNTRNRQKLAVANVVSRAPPRAQLVVYFLVYAIVRCVNPYAFPGATIW